MRHVFAIKFNHRQAVDVWQVVAQPRLTEQQRNAAVLHQIAQALGRIGRVQGHISTAGLENRQQADDHLRRTFNGQSNPHFRANAQLAQAISQAVGTSIELRVTEPGVGKDQRRGVRTNRSLRFDQLMHTPLSG